MGAEDSRDQSGPWTDERAAERIREIAATMDNESAHLECDSMLVLLLRQAGFEKAVEAYNQASCRFWYA